MPAPTDCDLAALRQWNQSAGADGVDAMSLVQQTLIARGCRNPGDSALFVAYLSHLLRGEYVPSKLDWLTLPALQQAGAVLMAWRERLLQLPGIPGCLDRLVLDCLSEAQALAVPRLLHQRDERDHATGLPDRTAMPRLLAQARERTEPERIAAYLHVEITTGPHLYPDTLLHVVAGRLAQVLRGQDALMLIDRQTFGLVLANLNGEGHAMLAAHRVKSCFDEPFLLEDESIRLTPRIGIALTPEHGETPEQLLAAGLTAALHHSEDGIGVYDPQRDRLNYALKKLEIPLRRALQDNLFHLAFQPQIRCADHAFFGMESLLRWQDDTLGLVRPDEIVLVAEHLGLMGPLTHWILNASLREYSKLIKHGIPGSISINLAPVNLRDRELPAAILDALSVWQVPAWRVMLEITESALIENIDQALDSLHALKRIGCKLALDDFGTGYSSLSYLKRLPIDELKIDRSFIVTMRDSEKDAGIVDAIIKMAHLMGLVVVTEGVEDEETVAMLARMGNDVIQGYYFSKPLPSAAIPAFIATLK